MRTIAHNPTGEGLGVIGDNPRTRDITWNH